MVDLNACSGATLLASALFGDANPSGLRPATVDVRLAVTAADLVECAGAASAGNLAASSRTAAPRAIAKLEIGKALSIGLAWEARASRRNLAATRTGWVVTGTGDATAILTGRALARASAADDSGRRVVGRHARTLLRIHQAACAVTGDASTVCARSQRARVSRAVATADLALRGALRLARLAAGPRPANTNADTGRHVPSPADLVRAAL